MTAPVVESAPVTTPAPAQPVIPAAPTGPLTVAAAAKLVGSAAFPTGAPPAPAHHSAEQPRADDGTFVNPLHVIDPDPAADPADPASPTDAAAETPAVEAGAEGEAPAADEPAPELLVKIPGRDPDTEIELEVADQQTAEQLRHLVNNFERGTQLKAAAAELARREEALLEQTEGLGLDPVRQIAERLTQTSLEQVQAITKTAALPALVLSLLAQPNVFEAVQAELAAWEDPNEAKARRADIREAYGQDREALADTAKERAMVRKAVGAYKSIVTALIPPALTDEQLRQQFTVDAMQDIYRAAQQSEAGILHPRDVPAVLERRLGMFGMTKEQITQALAVFRRGGPTPPAPRRIAARPTGQTFVQAKAKRAAAALPGPGVGAQPARQLFNPTDSIAQRAKAFTAKPPGQ